METRNVAGIKYLLQSHICFYKDHIRSQSSFLGASWNLCLHVSNTCALRHSYYFHRVLLAFLFFFISDPQRYMCVEIQVFTRNPHASEKTTMPEVISLTGCHLKPAGRGQCPCEGLIMSSPPLTPRKLTGLHTAAFIFPSPTPLGFTSSPLSIIRRQSNYCLESEPSIVCVNALQLDRKKQQEQLCDTSHYHTCNSAVNRDLYKRLTVKRVRQMTKWR